MAINDREGKVVIAGYDIVARAQVCGGGPAGIEELLVLNNNHNHYLVIGRELEATHGKLIFQAVYDDEEEAIWSYRLALDAMVFEAKKR